MERLVQIPELPARVPSPNCCPFELYRPHRRRDLAEAPRSITTSTRGYREPRRPCFRKTTTRLQDPVAQKLREPSVAQPPSFHLFPFLLFSINKIPDLVKNPQNIRRTPACPIYRVLCNSSPR